MLGTAFKKALGDKVGVRRFASGLFPLDEALVQVALDLSGRPFLTYEIDPVSEWIGTFDPQLAEEFWRAFVQARGHHAAPAVAVGQERSPRDRGVVQGRGPVPARRGARRERRAPVARRARCRPLSRHRPARRQRGAPAPRRLRGRDRLRRGSGRRSRATSRPQGARWIHVVDLDAARTGEPANLATRSRRSARRSTCPVQSGGGVRSVAAAGDLLAAGVARVVVGTAAVEHPELVDELARAASRRGRGRARRARAGRRGARLGRGQRPRSRRRSASGSATSGVAALIVTEIGRDGTLEGPDLDQLGAVLARDRRPGRRERRGRHDRRPARARWAGRRRPPARRARSSAGRSTSAASPWPRASPRCAVSGFRPPEVG